VGVRSLGAWWYGGVVGQPSKAVWAQGGAHTVIVTDTACFDLWG